MLNALEAGSWKLAAISKFNCQVSTLDVNNRYPVRPPSFFEHHHAVLNGSDSPGKRGLPVQRLARHEFGHAPLKPAVIRFMPQRSIEAWRRNFQSILLGQCRFVQFVFLDIEHRAEVLTHSLAILDTDRFLGRFRYTPIGPIDNYAQHRADRFPAQLDVKNLQPVAARHTLSGFADPRQFLVTRRKNTPETQKVGTSPLGLLPRSWHPPI
ncbi:MAG: hypothetical protein WBC51_25890 [Vicinamibacterales bacterium]